MLKLMTRQAATDDTEISPIGDNPRFAAAVRLLLKFQTQKRGLEIEIQSTQAAAYLRSQSGDDADSIGLAQKMLDGETFDARDGQVRIIENRKKIEMLAAAIRQQNAVVDGLRGELSFAVAKKIEDRHREALRELFVATRELVRCAAVERAMRNELLENGYFVLEQVIPAPQLAGALVIGDEGWCDSGISHYRRQLEAIGVDVR